MCWFHLKSFFRTLLKAKLLTTINLFGLVTGIFVSLLVWMYVSYELSYDNEFNTRDRIYRIIRNWQGSEMFDTSLPAPLGKALEEGIPEIEASVRVYSSLHNVLIRNKDIFREDLLLVVDPSFFRVFGIPLEYGNAASCLSAPNEMAISRSAARRLFGREDAIGETISIESGTLGMSHEVYTVTGIYKDFPKNSHLTPDILLSSSSFHFMDNPSHYNHFLRTYILLDKPGLKEQVEKKLPAFMEDFYGSEYYNFSGSSFRLQSPRDIHLNSKVYPAAFENPKGSYFAVRFLPTLAVLIMFISLVNFINLYTSQSLGRRKEMWLKKVNGAPLVHEFLFFIFDSVLIFLICLAIALALVEISGPWFESMTGRHFDLQTFLKPGHLAVLIPVIFVIGAVTGIYPARILFSAGNTGDREGWSGFRTIGVFYNSRLIILQFTLCLIFLVASILVYKQFNFIMKETAKGYNPENVILIRNPWYLGNSHRAFKEALSSNNNIEAVTSSESVPGIDNFSVWGHPVDSASNDLHIAVFYCDYNFADALRLKMIQGRFFSEEYPTDPLAIVLNETAVRELGWKQPIGKRYRLDTVYHVIGVVGDMHFESLYNPIAPMGLVLIAPGSESFISVRSRPGRIDDAVAYIGKTWKSFVPDRPLEYTFLDTEVSSWYENDKKVGTVITLLALLSVVLSSLGLLGVMLYSILRRTKEIAIRKVNGAHLLDIYSLFAKEVGKWILIAFLFATPVSFLSMRRWMQNFAFRTEINWWIFLLSLLVMLLISLATILALGSRISGRNPADSLRYE